MDARANFVRYQAGERASEQLANRNQFNGSGRTTNESSCRATELRASAALGDKMNTNHEPPPLSARASSQSAAAMQTSGALKAQSQPSWSVSQPVSQIRFESEIPAARCRQSESSAASKKTTTTTTTTEQVQFDNSRVSTQSVDGGGGHLSSTSKASRPHWNSSIFDSSPFSVLRQ